MDNIFYHSETGEVIRRTDDDLVYYHTHVNLGDITYGGVVAYIYQPGDPGYDSENQHGLITQVDDLSDTAQWYSEWPTVSVPGANGIVLGTGLANTIAIVADLGAFGVSAKLCDDLIENYYNDWVLPSKDELNKLWLNKVIIGNFDDAAYWSSSNNGTYSWYQNFLTGSQVAGTLNNTTLHTRAIRYF